MLSPRQRKRTQALIDLARKHRNCSLAPCPPYRDLYREFSPRTVERTEKKIRQALEEAIFVPEVPIWLAGSRNVLDATSLKHSRLESRKGNVMHLAMLDVQWIEENWKVFSGEFEFGSRRNIHLIFPFTKDSLKTLVAPWWEPGVLTNPSISSSPRTVAGIHGRLKPGFLAFSLSLLRLNACEIFFHPQDIPNACRWICEAANKTEWWR
jgi:hypothetical protein